LEKEGHDHIGVGAIDLVVVVVVRGRRRRTGISYSPDLMEVGV